MAAIKRGLHVLCEKLLARTSAEARRLTDAAEAAGLVTMCPFTYRFMPVARWRKELVNEGYPGRPSPLSLRYFAGNGRGDEYMWRFDLGKAGGGSVATAVFGRALERGPRPDGASYDAAEDSAMILLQFQSGATGSLHVSVVAYEPSPFGQLHQMELHGSEGTLHAICDWDRVQHVDGCRPDEPRW